ncbi:hypothetical protein J2T13_001980 [Paenibacillus sp. DS2015]|uniref:SAM-dependent methyltransferase n=1 Tax=Paenibacillus sp. DS2015 TaxID=3373917 RepID=UPI003D22C5B3
MSLAEVNLSRVVFIGRTFDEYLKIFNLTREELAGRKILDCPAGACSFTAIANQNGIDVTATDIAYYHPVNELEKKGLEDIEHAIEYVEKLQNDYVWNYFKSIAELKQHRVQALTECVRDMKHSPARYVPAFLPELPFSDREIELTLSAHLLFMYADKLDYDFHMKTIQELMRVTQKEIRIFPLVDGLSRRYEYLDEILAFIHAQGWTTEEIKVPYEFLKGANTMLKINRGKG